MSEVLTLPTFYCGISQNASLKPQSDTRMSPENDKIREELIHPLILNGVNQQVT